MLMCNGPAPLLVSEDRPSLVWFQRWFPVCVSWA